MAITRKWRMVKRCQCPMGYQAFQVVPLRRRGRGPRLVATGVEVVCVSNAWVREQDHPRKRSTKKRSTKR